MYIPLDERRGISSPRIRAKRVSRSSSRPRLPGGLVRLFQRPLTADSSAASSKFGMSGSVTGEYFSVVLVETFGVGADKARRKRRVHDHVGDDGGGLGSGEDDVQGAVDAGAEVGPGFAAGGGDAEPVLGFAAGGVGPALLNLHPVQSFPFAEVDLGQLGENDRGHGAADRVGGLAGAP